MLSGNFLRIFLSVCFEGENTLELGNNMQNIDNEEETVIKNSDVKWTYRSSIRLDPSTSLSRSLLTFRPTTTYGTPSLPPPPTGQPEGGGGSSRARFSE